MCVYIYMRVCVCVHVCSLFLLFVRLFVLEGVIGGWSAWCLFYCPVCLWDAMSAGLINAFGVGLISVSVHMSCDYWSVGVGKGGGRLE